MSCCHPPRWPRTRLGTLPAGQSLLLSSPAPRQAQKTPPQQQIRRRGEDESDAGRARGSLRPRDGGTPSGPPRSAAAPSARAAPGTCAPAPRRALESCLGRGEIGEESHPPPAAGAGVQLAPRPPGTNVPSRAPGQRKYLQLSLATKPAPKRGDSPATTGSPHFKPHSCPASRREEPAAGGHGTRGTPEPSGDGGGRRRRRAPGGVPPLAHPPASPRPCQPIPRFTRRGREEEPHNYLPTSARGERKRRGRRSRSSPLAGTAAATSRSVRPQGTAAAPAAPSRQQRSQPAGDTPRRPWGRGAKPLKSFEFPDSAENRRRRSPFPALNQRGRWFLSRRDEFR